MKKQITILAILLFSFGLGVSFAQDNLMQDDDGESSFPLQTGDTTKVTINVKDKKLVFGLVYPEVLGPAQWSFWNFSVFLKGKDKQFPAVKKGIPNFEGGFTGTYAHYLNKKSQSNLYASVELAVSRIQTFDGMQMPDDVITTETSFNTEIQFGYNNDQLFKLFKRNVLFGAGFRIGNVDNTDILSSFEYAGLQTSQPSFQVSESAQEVYLADQFEQITRSKVLVDIGVNTCGRFHPMFHFRRTWFDGDGITSPGLAIYLSEINAPLSAVLGLQYFVNDWTDAAQAETSRWERTSINLVAGFKL